MIVLKDIRLLLVDDDESFLKLTKLSLIRIKKNLKITTVTSGKDALILLKKQHFDVIVSDFQMPKMDGLELLKNVKKLYSDIPFIVFTGKGREAIAIQALNLGASYYHQKAFETETQFRELINFIESAVFRKRTEDSLKEIQMLNKMQIQASPIPMVLWEKKGKDFLLRNINDAEIEIANRAEEAEELFNMTAKEFYKNNPILLDLLLKCFSSKKAISQDVDFTSLIENESKWIRVQCAFISSKKILVTIIDLTSLKLKESANQRLINHQEAINELAIVLGETQDIKEAYRIIYTYSLRIMNATTFIVSSYDTKKKIFTAKFGIAEGNEFDVSKFPPIPLDEKGKGTQSRVIHSGEIYYFEDLEEHFSEAKTLYSFNKKGEIIEGLPRDKSKRTVKSAVYVPMRISGEIIGVLIFQNLAPKSFTEKDLELLTTFANLSAIGLKNASLIEDLVQSDKLYSNLVDSMNDGFVIVDKNGVFNYVNDKFCEILGYSKEEILGCSARDFLDRKNKKSFDKEIEQRNLGFIEPYQLYWTRKNGLLIPTSIKPKILYDSNGNTSGRFAVISDISVIKQVEEKLRTKQIELQKQKDELESFASTVSHDLKGRLQILMALAEMDQSEYSEMLIDQLDDLSTFIENLLLLAKRGEILGELSAVNLNELFEKMARNISTTNPEIKIIIRDLPTLISDPMKLSQVFENLLINILRHAKATKVEIFAEETKKEHIIHIRDNGIGMTNEKQEEIRASWKSRRYKSFGMLIVLKIVKAHKGKMKLNSQKGKGTTVSVYFPKKDEKTTKRK